MSLKYEPASEPQTPCDVTHAFTKIPLVEYPEWNDFARAAPYSATWVSESE